MVSEEHDEYPKFHANWEQDLLDNATYNAHQGDPIRPYPNGTLQQYSEISNERLIREYSCFFICAELR